MSWPDPRVHGERDAVPITGGLHAVPRVGMWQLPNLRSHRSVTNQLEQVGGGPEDPRALSLRLGPLQSLDEKRLARDLDALLDHRPPDGFPVAETIEPSDEERETDRSAGLVPDPELPLGDIRAHVFAAPAEVAELPIVNRAGSVRRNVLKITFLHHADEEGAESVLDEVRAVTDDDRFRIGACAQHALRESIDGRRVRPWITGIGVGGRRRASRSRTCCRDREPIESRVDDGRTLRESSWEPEVVSSLLRKCFRAEGEGFCSRSRSWNAGEVPPLRVSATLRSSRRPVRRRNDFFNGLLAEGTGRDADELSRAE